MGFEQYFVQIVHDIQTSFSIEISSIENRF